MHDVEKMYTYVKGFAMGADLKNTLSAMYYARTKHSDQKRNGGEPYIVHPLSMVCMAIAMGIKDDVVLASIMLHDVVEDCGVELKDLPVSCEVREVVNLLTFKMKKGRDKKTEKRLYFDAISTNGSAMLVKLIDRCNNISTMAGVFKKDRLLRYIEETKTEVLPLYQLCKEMHPEYSNALYLLKFQIESILYSIENSILSYTEQKSEE
jgi:GTP pyrophosphokinase